MQRNYTSINDLPPEILHVICTRLDTPTKRISRLVCRKWHDIINMDMVLRVRLSDDTLRIFRGILHLPIEELRVNNFQISDANCQSSSRSVFSNKDVRSLVLCGTKGKTGISEQNTMALFRLLREIRSLTIEQDAFWTMKINIRALQYLQLNYLAKLSIALAPRRFSKQETLPYICLFKNRFPHLLELSFRCEAYDMSMSVIISLFSFICCHKKTLRKLKMSHVREYKYFAVEEKRAVKSGLYEEIQQGFSELRLDRLSYDHIIETYPVNGARWQNIEVKLIHSQTSLKTFHSHVQFPLETPNYRQIILTNMNTLEDLYILAVTLPEPIFDFQWVEKCEMLTILNLCIINLGSRETDRNNYFNIQKLPKKLVRLTLGTTIDNWEVDWMVENLNSLKEICFCMKWKNHEANSLNQFKRFLILPRLSNYTVLDWKCPLIAQFIKTCPGIIDRNKKSPHFTDVFVDRSVFNVLNIDT